MALIFDVGMHNGDDTAFYLHQGHSVVAIEANPDLVDVGRKRFCDHIKAGKLKILNVAIGETPGEQDFWICDDSSDWSSLYRHCASWKGSRHHCIRVKVVPFGDILAEFGTPFYLKIDIEGSDHLCLRALANMQPPPYISAEADEELRILSMLKDCGYRRFKLIRQANLHPVYKSSLYSETERLVDSILYDSSRRYRLMRVLGARPLARGLWSRVELKSRLEKRAQWKFPLGSSGPWGDETPGRWLEFSEAKDVYEHGRAEMLKSPHPADFWCDWHAAA
jgi:FkbM family methyltransferase